MDDEVTITGLRELQTALRQLPKEMQGKVLLQALRDGGKVIIKDARARAPRDTGKLAKNIVIRREKETDSTATVKIGVRKAFYWRFLEFGTEFIKARPFMRPAFEAKKYEVAEAIKLALRKRIDAAQAKLSRVKS